MFNRKRESDRERRERMRSVINNCLNPPEEQSDIRELRKESFGNSIEKYFRLGKNLNQRDRGVSGLANYVISDIHGCYDEFQEMLHKINRSDNDRLILAGEYIDRGPESKEMLYWLEECPKNVIPIKGNHDVEFVEYVNLMRQTDKTNS